MDVHLKYSHPLIDKKRINYGKLHTSFFLLNIRIDDLKREQLTARSPFCLAHCASCVQFTEANKKAASIPFQLQLAIE